MNQKFMRKNIYMILILLLYPFIVVYLADYMKHKPFDEKVGYIPAANVMKLLSADHKQLTGAMLVMKTLIYYGSLLGRMENKLYAFVDYQAMSRTVHAAVRLDPYNMDAYYFAQGILVWDVKQIKLANDFLEYGMKFRNWDWYLPYYAGFNYAFFLRDFNKAAKYYQRAGELSGQPLFMTLAGRYMYESGRTDLAIAYLSAMEKNTRNVAIRETLRARKRAFIAALEIEHARDLFVRDCGRFPESVNVLIIAGYLKSIPKDPYGGKFYLTENGKVSSTSGFSSAGVQ